MIEHKYKPDGHCERCGQTPWEEGLGVFNLAYGRSRKCLTDEQLRDMKVYDAAVAKITSRAE